VTIAGVFALSRSITDDTVFVLGGFQGVLIALMCVLLEKHELGVDEIQHKSEKWTALGRELGVYLVIGFTASAVVMENLFGEVFAWHRNRWQPVDLQSSDVTLRVLGVGLLGAFRWVLVPVLITRCSMVCLIFLDLSTALGVSVIAAHSAIQAFAATCTVGGIWWWNMIGGGGLGLKHIRTILILLGVAMVTIGSLLYFSIAPEETIKSIWQPKTIISLNNHPIPALIEQAGVRYIAMQQRQSKTLFEAVAEYKRRYKMNPPPKFDKWYAFAKKREVVLIDEFDTIYHSIKPFWGLPPKELRQRAREAMAFESAHGPNNNGLLHAYIRNGQVQEGGQGPDWQKKATIEMIKKFAEWLPDMDLPFNIHDEPRVVVPYDMLAQHLEKAEKDIGNLHLKSIVNTFSSLNSEERKISPPFSKTKYNVFAHQAIWTHATLSCSPDSPVRSIDVESVADIDSGLPLGFIVNSTASSNICNSPSLENSYGFFSRPNAYNTVQLLYPIFSQSKISSFGDILYPSPWYWAGKVEYDEKEDLDWGKKIEQLYWRGSTTGGFSRGGSWKNQHRQRFVATVNGNDTAKILQPEKEQTEGTGPHKDKKWTINEVPRESLQELFNVYFSHVGQCDDDDCEAQRRFFQIKDHADQQEAWGWKYLLDIDGNAFSGRFYTFLKSKSAVFKLAIFREWHDDWLIPWVHYIPLSVQLDEVAEVLRFFRFDENGDKYAKRIAEESTLWANKVLRNEDMEVWFFRLLLE
jgi:hypothetical protein